MKNSKANEVVKKFKTWILQFTYNYQVAICVVFALVGFIFSVLLLTNRNGVIYKDKRNTPYGEIYIKDKKKLLLGLLEKRADSLTLAVNEERRKLTALNPKSLDSIKIVNTISGLNKVIAKTVLEHNSINYGLADTAKRIYTQYIFPDRLEYLKALKSDKWNGDTIITICVKAQIIDTSKILKSPINYTTELPLKQNKRSNLMDFITDYPQFGLWIVLTIAQMMLWFLLFPLLTGNLLDLRLKLGIYFCIDEKKIIKNSIVPFVFIAVFIYAFYQLLADSRVIADNYFFTNYNKRFRWYALFGYLLAIYCFGTFITITRQVTDMDELAKKNLVDRTAPDLNDKYLSLKGAFDNSFLASAIVLSFLVIWVGVTVNAVNSIESIKFYSLVSGKVLIPEDFIYLMGLLHTIVLLSFYIPAKLKFDSIAITKQGDPNKINDTTGKKIFNVLTENLGTILVTTSPIIASFIQNLLKVFTSN